MSEVMINGAVWYLVFLFSTTCHEAAHAWAAWRMGDDTAYKGGQVSLDPRPHVRREFLGMVVVPVLMFMTSSMMLGWASTPYDRKWALDYPKRSALMSLAGPAANLGLVLVAAGLIYFGISRGWYLPPAVAGEGPPLQVVADGLPLAAAHLISVLFVLNLLLFLFNLLPVPPFDGSGVVGLFLPEQTARKYMISLSQPLVGLLCLLAAFMYFGEIFAFAYRHAVELLYPGINFL